MANVLTNPDGFFSELSARDVNMKIPAIIVLVVAIIDAIDKVVMVSAITPALPSDVAQFAGIFAAATTYIIMKFDGSLSDQMLNLMEEEIMKSGMSDDMLENVEKMYKIMVTPGVVAFSGFINKVFTGTLISLIVAAFVKKNPESGFYEAVKDVE